MFRCGEASTWSKHCPVIGFGNCESPFVYSNVNCRKPAATSAAVIVYWLAFMFLEKTALIHEAGPTTVVAMSAGVTSAISSGTGRVIAPRRVSRRCPLPPEKPAPIPPADPAAAYCTFSVKCTISQAPTAAPLDSVTVTPLRMTKTPKAVPIAVSVASDGHRAHG